MRIPSSSSFLLASLAVSSSSSSLSALAAPAAEPMSTVATSTQSCTMSMSMSSMQPSGTSTAAQNDPTDVAMFLASAPVANSHLAARGLLDLAGIIKGLPVVGDPLYGLLHGLLDQLGLGASPGALAAIQSMDPAKVQAAVANAAEGIQAALQSAAGKVADAAPLGAIPIPVSSPLTRDIAARDLDLFKLLTDLPAIGPIFEKLLTQLGLGPETGTALLSAASTADAGQVQLMLAQTAEKMKALLEAEISKAAQKAPIPLPLAPTNGTVPFPPIPIPTSLLPSPPVPVPTSLLPSIPSSLLPVETPQTPRPQKRSDNSDTDGPLPSPWSPAPSSTYSSEPMPSSTEPASSSADPAQAFGMNTMTTSSAWPSDMTPSAIRAPPLLSPKMPQNPPNSPEMEMRGFNGARPMGSMDW
ncbi:hypothetical protein OF83DRAFT_1079859 [Amylostereum chailletii]|nr:hypothetical protein OF83DRAFT_1079859 [Amylostereum chailletii]